MSSELLTKLTCPKCRRQSVWLSLEDRILDFQEWKGEAVLIFDVRKAPQLSCSCGFTAWGTVDVSGCFRFQASDLDAYL